MIFSLLQEHLVSISHFYIKYLCIFLRHTSKHISDSTNALLCVLFEQHARSVGYSIEVKVGLLKY